MRIHYPGGQQQLNWSLRRFLMSWFVLLYLIEKTHLEYFEEIEGKKKSLSFSLESLWESGSEEAGSQKRPGRLKYDIFLFT